MTPKLLSTRAGRQPARLIFALLAAAVLLLAQQPTPANAYPLWTSSMVAGLGDEEVDGPLDLKFDAAGNPYLAIGNVDPPTDLTRWGLLLAEWDGSAWRTSRAYARAVCIGYQQTDLSLAVSADGSRAAISFWESCDARIAVVLGTKTPEGTWNWAFTELPYAPDPDSHVGPTFFPSAVAYDGNGFLHLIFGMDFQVYHTWYSPFSGWTTRQEVTDSSHANRFYWLDVSLAIDAGNRLHAAFDYGDNEGHSALTTYAYQNILSGDWVNEDVAGAGGHHSLAVDSRGQARIAFHDSRDHSLKYAQRTGVDTWTITTVDTADPGETLGDAGLYPSLALDAADHPHVSYIYDYAPNTTWGTIRYAAYDGATWQKESVELARNYMWTALALDNAGTPHVTYIANEDVPYATRGDATGAPPPDTYIDSGPARVDNDDTVTFTFHSDDPAATFECLGPSTSFVACTSPHTWAIGAGPHYTFWVRAVSAGQTDPSPAFYTFTRDMIAPDSRIISGPATDSPDPTFTFTANEPSTFQCRIRLRNNIPPGYVVPVMQPCASPKTFTGVDDGNWVFELMATDAFGNAETYANAATYYWTLDQIGPPTTITGGKPAAVTTSTTASFTFSSIDASYTFECQLDGGLFAACASPQSYSNLADGSHTFQVRAIDDAALEDPTPAGHTWTVDTVAPDTTLTGKPYNPSRSNSATFTFSSGEAGATFECQLDSGDFAACASPQSYSNLADGSHTFSVQARDAAGNVDASPATYTWIIDTVVPDTTLDATPPNPSTSASATFTFSSNDIGATFACKLDSGDYLPCASPKSYNGLADGSHTLTVRAGDAAGNLDLTPAVYTWTLDATPPNTTITTKPAALSNDPTPDFAFTSSEGNYAAGIYFYCQTDANAWFPCGGDSITYYNLFDGDHTFRVKAEDTLGNVDPTPATWSWTMDLTAPETTITAKPTAATSSTNATFEFTSSEAGTFECKLDSGIYAACTSPKSYTGLSEASHTFQARATDTAGNVGSPAGYTWTIDTTPPETTITAHPDALTNSATASFSFTGVGAASFECKLDSGGFVACTSPISYTGLYNGSHTFHVWAIDAAGNYDTSTASYTWTVDTNPPETTITQWPASPSVGNTAVFTFSSETGATFECRLDGAAFATCTSPQNYTGLSDGSHTFQVRARDAAGNADTSPASYTWVIDATPPDTSITGKPDAITSSTSVTFTFNGVDADSFECKLDSDVYAACTSPQSYNGLAAGSHTFFVRAKDTEGRYDPTPASYTWIVDTTPPDTTITGQPAAMTNNTTADFTFSSAGATSFECRLDTATFAACTSPKTYTGLAAASHTFEVRAKDAAGNVDPSPASYTWLVDTTPPTVTINQSSGQPDPTSSSPINFTVVFNEAVSGFATGDVTLGGTAGATTVTVTQIAPNNGTTYTVAVSGMTGDGTVTATIAANAAHDAAGNANTASTSADNSVTYTAPDTSPPDTTIDTWIGDVYTVDTITIDFSSNEANSTFACKLDGGGWAACVSPVTYNALADGPHTFEVRATDAASNTDPSPATATWTVQTPGPDTSIDSYPPDPSTSRAATFTFSSAEATQFECSLDAADFAACASPHVVSGLADGLHFFLVRAVNAQGRVDDTPAERFWFVDATPPAVTINQAATQADPTNAGPVHFTILFTEPVNDFNDADVTLSGTAGAMAAVATNLHDHMEYDVAVSGMTGDGTVIATVAANVAHDAAGNGNTASTSTDNTVTYNGFDTTPPETTLTAAPDTLTNNNDPSFSFSSDEPGSSFTCQLDSQPAAACATPQSYTDLTDGSHTFTVFATDAAGNADPSPASHTWTIDTTGPDTTINSGPSGITGDNDPSFGFSSEPGATFECQLDSGAWASCASPKGYTDLADGPHTFRVRAGDAAGNTGPTAERAFTVDSAAPSVSIDTHPPALTNNNDPTFTFSGEAGAALACKLDGGAFAACDSPKSYTDLADGEHTFKVRATDSAGNSAEAAYTWTIDTTPPATTITAAPPNPSASPDASFSFTSESGAAFECRLDGGLWGVCANPRFYAGLSEGSHTFEVRASDLAGNTGPAAGHTWIIDLPAPFALYVTASGGRITNGPTYQKNDILKWDGSVWSVWFDGASKGLPANADIIAFDVDNDTTGSAWVVIRQATKLPGVGKMQPNEIAYYNGSTWSRFFDGGDVGLKTSGEHINGLEVLPGAVSPIGNGCQYYLLISTVAGGGVPIGNTNVKFTGEDVLGFCMTRGGANTAGAWRMVFEGQSEGLPKNNNYGLSSSDDASTLYFTAKSNFTGDGGLVKPSEVFSWSGGVFSGPLWKAKDHGLMQVVDGIDVVGLFQ